MDVCHWESRGSPDAESKAFLVFTLLGVKTGEFKWPVSNEPICPVEGRKGKKGVLASAHHLLFWSFRIKRGELGAAEKEQKAYLRAGNIGSATVMGRLD